MNAVTSNIPRCFDRTQANCFPVVRAVRDNKRRVTVQAEGAPGSYIYLIVRFDWRTAGFQKLIVTVIEIVDGIKIVT